MRHTFSLLLLGCSALLGCGGPNGPSRTESTAAVPALDGSGTKAKPAEETVPSTQAQPDQTGPASTDLDGPAGGEPGLGAPQAKRVAPPDVLPVTIGDLRFEAIHWGRERGLAQNGGYLAAFDATSGKELWILKVYDVPYDPQLEEDVQDVFIESLAQRPDGQELEIEDEDGRKYIVNPRDKSVRPLVAPASTD